MNGADRSEPGSSLPTRRDAQRNRQLLLDAATREFSSKGYQDARVRDICQAAGLNVGAVNQHFGSKQSLYREVLVLAGKALSGQVPCPRLEDFDRPEEALHAWMEYHLTLVLLRRARDPVAGPLLMRELRNPTDAIEAFAHAVVLPIRSELVRIVAALLGDGAPRALRESAANFVYGLGVFHAFAAPVLERIGQKPAANERDVARLLGHLFPFALGGIRALREDAS